MDFATFRPQPPDAVSSPRLRLSPAGSPRRLAESGSSPADRRFASGCSPPHLTVTQSPSTTGRGAGPTGTLTPLSMQSPQRTGARTPCAPSSSTIAPELPLGPTVAIRQLPWGPANSRACSRANSSIRSRTSPAGATSRHISTADLQCAMSPRRKYEYARCSRHASSSGASWCHLS